MYQLIIADDEFEIASGIANYFPWEEIGFEVVSSFSNGQEVLSWLRKHSADVFLCDIRMPIMNGIELAKKIQEENISIKIVFLSGYSEFEYARQALIYGAVNYLLKPTKYNELVSVFTSLKQTLDQENFVRIEDHPEPDALISTLQELIQNDYANITLESAANQVYLSPVYVSRLFKQHTGINFIDYVTKVRMKKAAEMISSGKYKIYEISEFIGYSNPNNFARAFKKFFGIAPQDYRHFSNRRQ